MTPLSDDLTVRVISSERELCEALQFLERLPLNDSRSGQGDPREPRPGANEMQDRRGHIVTQCTDERGAIQGVLVCRVKTTVDTISEAGSCTVQVRYAAIAAEYRVRPIIGMGTHLREWHKPPRGRSYLEQMWTVLVACVLRRFGGTAVRGELHPDFRSIPFVRRLFLPCFKEGSSSLALTEGFLDTAECTFCTESVVMPPGFGPSVCGGAAASRAHLSEYRAVLSAANLESSTPSSADYLREIDIQTSQGLRHCLHIKRLVKPTSRELDTQYMQVSHSTGVYSFVVDPYDCVNMERFLTEHVCPLWERGVSVPIGNFKYEGYKGYQFTNCKFNGKQQARRTLLAPTPEMRETLLAHVPGLSNIFEAVVAQICPGNVARARKILCGLHILWQRDRLSEGQASFSWHVDTHDVGSVLLRKRGRPGKTNEKGAGMLSCIVQVTETVSIMQMYLFQAHAFMCRGSVALFNGGAVHRSVLCPDEPSDTFKVVCFFDV